MFKYNKIGFLSPSHFISYTSRNPALFRILKEKDNNFLVSKSNCFPVLPSQSIQKALLIDDIVLVLLIQKILIGNLLSYLYFLSLKGCNDKRIVFGKL